MRFSQRLRTLDALQLALALGTYRLSLFDYFVSADQTLCSIAQAEGMTVINPVP